MQCNFNEGDKLGADRPLPISVKHACTSNVCFIKIRSKYSSNTLLSLLPIFMKQTLQRGVDTYQKSPFAALLIKILKHYKNSATVSTFTY